MRKYLAQRGSICDEADLDDLPATGLGGAASIGSFLYPLGAAPRLMLVVLLLAVGVTGIHAAKVPAHLSPIVVDYPEEGSVFLRDIIPPTFLWRDPSPTATVWLIEVVFAERGRRIKVWSQGEKLQVGEIDTNIHNFVAPTLTPQEAASHTWKPDAKTWATIIKFSQLRPATVTVTGFRDRKTRQPDSRGQVTIATSEDPVGAPIFYRDVPLIPPRPEDRERGVIKPLPDSVLPLIKWRLRNVSEPRSESVMENLPSWPRTWSPVTETYISISLSYQSFTSPVPKFQNFPMLLSNR